jgi:two-component system sensor histidine kinase ArlS
MPVRIRITLLFSLLAFVILAIVCAVIYYFSYEARLDGARTRLRNRAISTARLLSQKEIFNRELMLRIDSSTTFSLKSKTVQAYTGVDRKFYTYSDLPDDSLVVDEKVLALARTKGMHYFTVNGKEAIAYHGFGPTDPLTVVVAGKDEEGHRQLQRLLRILLFSFLIGNIFVLVAGYLFSKGLLLPVRKISEDVTEISAKNLARRIQTGTVRDEWYLLSTTVNDLLDRLQDSFELQRRFVSHASHELSTPLTSISSQLEVSLQRPRDAEAYRAVMQSIYQDVRHMSKLTQTLLEIAKASGDAGGLEIERVRIDEVLLQLPAEALKAGPAFSVLLDFENMPENESDLLVFGNEALLLSALKNIVLNACKYSADQTATVVLRVVDREFLVMVKDNGPGIEEAEIGRIFQPFYRIDDLRKADGFGLGLSLANRIIRMHKGTITVDSVPGKGSCFLVQLPSAGQFRSE